MDALAALGEHIRKAHPEIDAVNTRVQWMGRMAHRGVVWEEHYQSLTALDEAPATPACTEVWDPIHALTLPGTHERTVLLDAEPAWKRNGSAET